MRVTRAFALVVSAVGVFGPNRGSAAFRPEWPVNWVPRQWLVSIGYRLLSPQVSFALTFIRRDSSGSRRGHSICTGCHTLLCHVDDVPVDIFVSYILTDRQACLQYLLLFWGAICVLLVVHAHTKSQHYWVLCWFSSIWSCVKCTQVVSITIGCNPSDHVSNGHRYWLSPYLPYLQCCWCASGHWVLSYQFKKLFCCNTSECYLSSAFSWWCVQHAALWHWY